MLCSHATWWSSSRMRCVVWGLFLSLCVLHTSPFCGTTVLVHAASFSHHSAHSQHVHSTEEDDEDADDDDDDDWDFLDDNAILATVAEQKATATLMRELCADSLDPVLLNDDYCDCDEDGSDEPETSACSYVLAPAIVGDGSHNKKAPTLINKANEALRGPSFHCRTSGQVIYSGFVLDGVCDCCDGSDEMIKTASSVSDCPNTCTAYYEEKLAKLYRRLENVKIGQSIRESYLIQADTIINTFHNHLEQLQSLSTTIQRALQARQLQLQAAGVPPLPEDRQAFEELYYQAQVMQFQVFMQKRLTAKATFEDAHWKRAFAPLVGQCFDFTVNEKEMKGESSNIIPREYVIVFCPFQNITQTEPSYPSWKNAERYAKVGVADNTENRDAEDEEAEAPRPIILGLWENWRPVYDMTSVATQRYDHGELCANGQHRQVIVSITCGESNRVTAVEENEMCIYSIHFSTSAACTEQQLTMLQDEIAQVQRDQQQQEYSIDSQIDSTIHEEL